MPLAPLIYPSHFLGSALWLRQYFVISFAALWLIMFFAALRLIICLLHLQFFIFVALCFFFAQPCGVLFWLILLYVQPWGFLFRLSPAASFV